jgi:hypothetical protein
VVALEPISSRSKDPFEACPADQSCPIISFSIKGDRAVVTTPAGKGSLGGTNGFGVVIGYAIDEATIGTTNVRVGRITFDLAQYDADGENLSSNCEMEDNGTYPCLNRVISALYEPLTEGAGEKGLVTGFLWWAPAATPYNY